MTVNRDEPRRRELWELLDIWDGARRGGRMPTTGSFGPIELAPFMQNLIVTQVIWPGPRFRYDMVGDELERIYGSRVSGRLLSEMPRKFRRFVEPAYREVVETKAPTFNKFRFMKSFWIASYERLMLPVGDARGFHVVEIIVAIYPSFSLRGGAERRRRAF